MPDKKPVIVRLPRPEFRGAAVEEAIAKRRSIRHYSRERIMLAQLSQLLFAAQGITGERHGHDLRTAPSAGATCPFEVYAAVHNAEFPPPGVYHYDPDDHALELVKPGDFRKELSEAGLRQEALAGAGVVFILSAVFRITTDHYGERGIRYVHMEAGHISQNIYLQATSMGLGSVAVGAFDDGKVNRITGADGRTESAVYMHAVGRV